MQMEVDTELLLEKEQAIAELREMVGIMSEKIKKLEQLAGGLRIGCTWIYVGPKVFNSLEVHKNPRCGSRTRRSRCVFLSEISPRHVYN